MDVGQRRALRGHRLDAVPRTRDLVRRELLVTDRDERDGGDQDRERCAEREVA
jgi:hypothetical protein